MGYLNKLRNKAQQARGRARQAGGRGTGDSRVEGRGRADRAEGGTRQVGEQAKDAAKKVRRAFRR